MIYANVELTVEDRKTVANKNIVLYRGDRNVEIRFAIKGNRFTVLDSTYAQMIIRRPSTTSVFSDPAPIQNDTVVFTISEDMIDELKEIGAYTFQVRLYDNSMNARATLPPCEGCLIINQPIAVEGEALVNAAMINDSAILAAAYSDVTEDETFDNDNTYNRTEWADGDIITDVRMNKIEDAIWHNTSYILELEDAIDSVDLTEYLQIETSPTEPTDEDVVIWINTSEDTPTDVIARINDDTVASNTVWSSEKVDNTLDEYATKTYVSSEIAKAQLEEEEIDLSGYATKDDVPTKTSELTNDSGFLTSIPDEYVTDSELNAKGYLTQHQDLSAYAKKTDIPSVPTEVSQLINDIGYVIESRVIELINLTIGDNTPIENPCTNITLNKSLLIFSDNNAQTLTATVTPSDTTDTIVWRSSDTLVATVEEGVVTPNSDGSCIITATCGSVSAVCNITVNIEQTEVQNAITLSQDSIVAENIGGNILISALLDESLEGKAIEWNSSDTNVATVTSYSLTSGLIVPKEEGTCEITATCGGYKATCVVKVEPKESGDDTGDDTGDGDSIPCTAISLSPKSYTFTQTGETTILLPTYTPYNTTDTVLWTSSNTAVAKVESGEVTCVGEGVCVITVYCGDYSDSCTVVANITSTSPSDPTNIPCTGVSVSPSSYTFTSIGQQVQLSATIQPSNTTDAVSWSSSSPGIATVNNGMVTSISNGETVITVQCGYYSDTTLITVQDESTSGSSDTLTGFTLSSDFNVNSKNYYRVEAIPDPSTFSGEYTVWWSSSDPGVLGPSSSSGKNMTFYPGKTGTCVMTVTVDAGLKGYYRKKFDVTVNIPDDASTTEILYSNPTITVENFKAKAVQGDVVQYFDVSYEPNTGNPSYVRSLELIDDDGNKYYLSLLNRGTSPFGVDGLHLDSGAWITEASESSGVPYRMQQSALSWQNFDKTIRVKNVNNTVDSELLSTAMFNASQAFPDIEYVIDSSSRNTIELVPNMDDQWLAQTSLNDDRTSFKIILNEVYFHKIYGPLSESTFNLWLSTVVHELGHALGPADNAVHYPTSYSYTRNIAACTYLQPNDIAWIKYLHKEMYGVELQTIQEKTQP